MESVRASVMRHYTARDVGPDAINTVDPLPDAGAALGIAREAAQAVFVLGAGAFAFRAILRDGTPRWMVDMIPILGLISVNDRPKSYGTKRSSGGHTRINHLKSKPAAP